MTELTVIDLGYGLTKGRRGGQLYFQPSIVGEMRDVFEQNIEPNDLIYDNKYFVGSLALRESDARYFSLKDNKAETWISEIILKTALGLMCRSKRTNLVTGLPVKFFFNQKSDMSNILDSISRDTFTVQKGRLKKFEASCNIESYKILPQGYGVAMDYLLDDNGKVRNYNIAKKNILVVDLGFYTLNLLALNQMKIGRESDSYFLGVSTAYKLLQKSLHKQFNVSPAIYEMDSIVLSGQYQGYNIKPLVDKAFKTLATQIQTEIDSLNTKYDLYLIAGGAAKFIFPHLNIPNKIELGQLAQINGYEKVGKRQWGP
ncbi:hypothetical protein D3C73_185370 [compost metagenome]